MPVRFARREFLSRLGAMAAATITTSPLGYALLKPESLSRPASSSGGDQQRKSSNAVEAKPLKSPFRVSVINDEISQDFGRACEVASREFGMEWIELRGMWKKNPPEIQLTRDRHRQPAFQSGLEGCSAIEIQYSARFPR